MHQMEFWGKLNPFKSGLVCADAISTVSPTYAKEIQTEAYGCGLEGVLKDWSDRHYGVINGIDQNVWNPQKDIYLKTSYSADDISGKKICKAELQKKSHLKIDSQIPLIGMVTRLIAQKGIDLLLDAFDEILQLNLQLVILGDGEQELINQLTPFSAEHPERISVTTGVFDIALAHQIYAGSDLFLMPSRFEPCGLAQMISMRYGTIPIVRATGGLADTVRQFSDATHSGIGFIFEKYEVPDLMKSVREAVDCFGSRHWVTLQQNAFASVFSWQRPATEYTKLYFSL
jgi:starch synthase